MKIKSWAKSSANENEISHTIQSAVRMILAILVSFGYLNAVDTSAVLSQIPVIVSAGYAAWQALETVFGASRKILVAITKEKE